MPQETVVALSWEVLGCWIWKLGYGPRKLAVATCGACFEGWMGVSVDVRVRVIRALEFSR